MSLVHLVLLQLTSCLGIFSFRSRVLMPASSLYPSVPLRGIFELFCSLFLVVFSSVQLCSTGIKMLVQQIFTKSFQQTVSSTFCVYVREMFNVKLDCVTKTMNTPSPLPRVYVSVFYPNVDETTLCDVES